MKKTRFTAAFMAAAIALTCVPFTAASAQEVPEEYAAERELGWYDDDEYISWEAVDDSEEAYETVESEEPEIYAWESGATTYNSTELGWSYVDGAAKYRVYKYSPSKGKYVKYKDVTGTTVKVTGLKAGIIGLGVSGKMIADALQFMGADIAYYSRTRKPDAEAVGMAYKPLAQLLTESEVVFTCLNKNVLLLGKDEFAQLGAGKVLFNTSIGPGFDSAALEQWLALPGTHFFCDTRAAAGPVGEDFFARENVHCANVSAGRTKQAFVLLSQKVLANIRTALGE